MEQLSNLMDTSLGFDLNLHLHQQYHPSSDEILPKRELQEDFYNHGRRTPAGKEEKQAGALVEELNRISKENRKLTEMLTVMGESYNALHVQLMDLMSKKKKNNSPESEANNVIASKKRKLENDTVDKNFGVSNGNNTELSSSIEDDESTILKKPRENNVVKKESRVLVRAEKSDASLIVKDGYQWRKYGQKVTKDNPSPRAYFRCSFAPGCPVKKKVQRSAEDPSLLVATYDGEHNHLQPCQVEVSSSGTNIHPISNLTPKISPPRSDDVALDLSTKVVSDERPAPALQQFIVEQMASSLTRDPTFTATLAAAISGRMLPDNTQIRKWL